MINKDVFLILENLIIVDKDYKHFVVGFKKVQKKC